MLVTVPCCGCLPSGAAIPPTPAYREAMVPESSGDPLAENAHSPRDFAIRPTSHVNFDLEDPQASLEAPPRAWHYIVLHHTATERGDVESIDAEHRRQIDREGKPWLGIGYHFVIGNGRSMPDGRIEPTFRWREQLHGAHAGDTEHNDLGIGICLVGNFEESAPTPLQVQACRQLVAVLAREYDIRPENVLAHSDVKATACPGRLFPLEQMVVAARSSWPARSNWAPDEAVFLPAGAEDGDSARRTRTVWPKPTESPLVR